MRGYYALQRRRAGDSGYGTALGVFRAAAEAGKKLKIYADETRPRLQGASLTAYELMADGLDVTVITDSMAAFLMSRTKIDAVITGADRVAANGDAANKIGTYGLAIAAKHHASRSTSRLRFRPSTQTARAVRKSR